MIRSRTLSTLVLFAAITLGAGAATLSPATASADDDKCQATKFDFPEVGNACKKGKKAAKELMKETQKLGKKAGVEFKCKDCHENQKDFKQKSNATADYKKLSKAAQEQRAKEAKAKK